MNISSITQGSLLRRTLLSVIAFVLASLAFLALVSFVCVSAAKGLLPSRAEPRSDEVEVGTPKLDGAGKMSPARKPGSVALPSARMQGKDG